MRHSNVLIKLALLVEPSSLALVMDLLPPPLPTIAVSELLCVYERSLDLRILVLDVRSLPDSRSRRESESAALVAPYPRASVCLSQSSEAMMAEAYLARALRSHSLLRRGAPRPGHLCWDGQRGRPRVLPCRRPWQLEWSTPGPLSANAISAATFSSRAQVRATACHTPYLPRAPASLYRSRGSTSPRRPPRYVVLAASSTLCGLYGLTTSRAPGANGCPLAVGPSTTRRAVVGIISRGASPLVSRDLSGLLTHETPVFLPLSSTCVPCSGGDLHVACLQLCSSVVCCIRSHRFIDPAHGTHDTLLSALLLHSDLLLSAFRHRTTWVLVVSVAWERSGETIGEHVLLTPSLLTILGLMLQDSWAI